jgi:hypothetical protein
MATLRTKRKLFADANAVGLPYVVIGTFGVIAHGFLRATKDSDLLVPGGADTDEAVVAPAGPAPTTMTSASASGCFFGAGGACSVT